MSNANGHLRGGLILRVRHPEWDAASKFQSRRMVVSGPDRISHAGYGHETVTLHLDEHV